MVVRGAPAIGVAAAFGIALEVLRHAADGRDAQLAAFDTAFAELAASRPTAVNLAWALNRQRSALTRVAKLEAADLAAALLDEAHTILREDIESNRAMGQHGAALIGDGARVLTHCNAGALATAGHGTALGVIRSAHSRDPSISVWVDETRPLLQGARLTMFELDRLQIDATLIADSAAASLMGAGAVDLVIVGADRIAANGDVANKVGTYSLAVLAHHHGLPFYVAAPTSTIDLATPDGDAISIEERDPGEVRAFGGREVAPAGAAVRNPAFDVTPARLVTAIITEVGVARRPYGRSLSSHVRRGALER
jgi:methylthioribose-1-phosphate isomerase